MSFYTYVACRNRSVSVDPPPHIFSPFFQPLFRRNFSCQEQVVCERLPARLAANAPHRLVSECVNHKCLFLPLSGLHPTSHGSRPVSLPRVSAAQVTQGGMTSTPHIHQAVRSSRREKTELNLGSYYSEQATCSKLCKNQEAFLRSSV